MCVHNTTALFLSIIKLLNYQIADNYNFEI